MALPKKLKDFNLFGDGASWQGQVTELTLPELTRQMEEYRGAGMDGTVELDFGQELITFEWTAGGLIADIFDNYATPIHDTNLLRFTGAYESDETGEITPVEIVVRGRHKTIAMGDVSAGEDNTLQVTTTCSYYKLLVDGEEVLEIDVPGYVMRVRGQDRLAQRRGALGI